MITIEEQWLISIRRGPDCDGEMTGFETLEEAEAEARRLGYTHTVRWYNLFAIGDDGEQLDDDPLFVSRPYRGVPNAKFNHGGINTVSPQGELDSKYLIYNAELLVSCQRSHVKGNWKTCN